MRAARSLAFVTAVALPLCTACTQPALPAVQITASVTAVVIQLQAIAAQGVIIDAALRGIDRDLAVDDALDASAARAQARLACATVQRVQGGVEIDLGPADALFPCVEAGRALTGLVRVEWVEFPGEPMRGRLEMTSLGTTGGVAVTGETYVEWLTARTVSLDAELEVEDPDVTSAAVGVVLLEYATDGSEGVDVDVILSGEWTWQSNAVGWEADFFQAEMSLGRAAPQSGFTQLDPRAERSVMLQYDREGDDYYVYANGGARDRLYRVEPDAAVVDLSAQD